MGGGVLRLRSHCGSRDEIDYNEDQLCTFCHNMSSVFKEVHRRLYRNIILSTRNYCIIKEDFVAIEEDASTEAKDSS